VNILWINQGNTAAMTRSAMERENVLFARFEGFRSSNPQKKFLQNRPRSYSLPPPVPPPPPMTQKLFFATPTYSGFTHSSLTQSLLELSASGLSFKYVSLSGCGIGLMRDRIAHSFLKSQADILFMVDADQSFSVQDIHLMLAAIERGAHVVGAAIAQKRLDLEALTKSFTPNDPLRAGITQHNVMFLPEGPRNGFKIGDKIFVAVDYIGAGLLAVTRKALETMSHRELKYHYEGSEELLTQFFRDGGISEKGTPEGEDVYFSRFARSRGVPVYAFANSDVLHHEGVFAFPSNLEACMRAAGHKLEF
jgi:hypothetical protein